MFVLKTEAMRLSQHHPDILISLNNLAGVFERQSKYERALPLYEEVLAKRMGDLGEDHPDSKACQQLRTLCSQKLLLSK